MSEKYERLKLLLLELFQLDKPDLDFGIYRIMHARAAEVTKFLDEDLLPQVKEALAGYEAGNREQIQAELDAMTAGLEAAGVDPASSPKVRELKAALRAAGDVDAVEGEVYDLIARFFKRYYSEGDFISQRRYRDDNTYSIPYSGEEVLLHWANKDQYYIKTSEHLDSYSFLLNPDHKDNPMRVKFRLVDAAEGEHGNVRSADAKARVFVLARADGPGQGFAHIIDGDLVIDFEFRPTTMADWPDRATRGKKPPAQKDMTAASLAAIAGLEGDEWRPWIDGLHAKYRRADESESERTKLEVHLDRYAKKNTFDYFIHKDLGGFLRRELDFFIKNEVMHLDDIENADSTQVATYLGSIRAVRRVAGKIIDFLAQLEDFQKKLWLKKKFVVGTSYLVSIGNIDESFYGDICTNSAQLREWIDLFRIDKEVGDLLTTEFTEPLSPEFLKTHPTMTLNTELFDADFTARLLESLSEDDLDEALGGLLIQADNFQAMNVLLESLRAQVDCFYLDPPYNTDAGPIDYKNGYRHSSWLASLADRLALAHSMLRPEGNVVLTIDDYEGVELSLLLNQLFGADQNLGTAVIRNNPSGRPTQGGLSVCHEYAYFFTKADGVLNELDRTEGQRKRYSTDESGELVNWQNFRKGGGQVTYRTERPKQFYPIFVDTERRSLRIPSMEWDNPARSWRLLEQPNSVETSVLPIDPDNKERVWSLSPSSARTQMDDLEVRIDSSGKTEVFRRHHPSDGVAPRSWWGDSKYGAREHGTAALKALFGSSPFSFAKSPEAVKDCLTAAVGHTTTSPLIVDFFGGSGTTAQAVIELNRDSPSLTRRFILVEGQQYFDEVLVPRVRKVAYADKWQGGSPEPSTDTASRPAPFGFVKVLRLESYEDGLNNLVFVQSKEQQSLLEVAGKAFREQYTLRYQLNVETEGSASLLTVSAFDDPMNYELMIKRPGSDESRPTKVDLIETFNCLIGLKVDGVTAPRTFTSTTSRDDRGRLLVDADSFRQSAEGEHWFRAVTGTNPQGDKVLVIWRNRPGCDNTDPGGGGTIEVDNTVLNYWFGEKQKYSVKDSEFDLIYVNGDNNLENVRRPDEQWKVRRIDDEFHRLMFDTSGMP